MGVTGEGETNTLDDRGRNQLAKLREYDFPNTAIERYLLHEDIEISEETDDFLQDLVDQLDEPQINNLIDEYKYAGRQTINYFVMKGISDYSFEQIRSSSETEFDSVDEAGLKTPYIVDTEEMFDNLYVCFAFKTSTGSQNPVTGEYESQQDTNYGTHVLNSDSDLVEVRCSNESMAFTVCRTIANSVGIENDDAIYRPEFGTDFQREFGEELVDKYYNLKVRADDEEGSTVDTIQFTSKTDEDGERRDARDDDRVSAELEERGGEITMGYVELDDDTKFHMNRGESKLSFRKYEMESQLQNVTEVIRDVLRETGEHSSREVRGLGNVPE